MKKISLILTGFGLGSLIIAFLIPYLFYVNVPCQDDWTLVPIVGHILDGSVTLGDFWAFRSEHRIFFPRLILCYWAAWTRWDMRVVPWVNLMLILSSTLCLSALAKQKKAFWVACIFVFSLHAVKTVVWIIQFHTFFTIALFFLAVYGVSRDPLSLKRWVFSSLLVMMATFSFGEGTVAWFAMLPLLIEARASKRFLSIVSIWIGSTVVSLALYFHGFPYAHNHPSASFVAHDPLYTAWFFLNYLGALFYPLPAGFFGALGFILVIAMVTSAYSNASKENGRLKALICVSLFVIGNAFITSMARSHYSIQGAVVDRYIPVSCFLWASISIWIVSKARNGLLFATPLFLAGALLLTGPFHWKDYKENRQFMESAADILRQENPSPAQIGLLFSEPSFVSSSIPILKKHELGIFRSSKLEHEV